jgi:hypothetical protein
MSILGAYAKLYIGGVLSGPLPAINFKPHINPGFLLLMYQNIIDCISLGTLFYVSAFLCGKRNIRVIDFYGTVALSRFPFLVLMSFVALMFSFDPQLLQIDISEQYNGHLSVIGIATSIFWIICFVWQALTYFFAFKESSGLEGRKLWISYIICVFILGDIISAYFFLFSIKFL